MQFQLPQNKFTFLYFLTGLLFLWAPNSVVVAAEAATATSTFNDQNITDYLADQQYKTALSLLEEVSSSYYTDSQLDDYILLQYESVNNVLLNIPHDYYTKPHTFSEEFKIDTIDHTEEIDDLLTNLTAAASNGHARSSYLLAELYMYGNYSIPKNAKLSLYYYKLTALLEDNGDANFMAGFIYTTGLFTNELAIDHARANLYFKAAADLDHPKALMTLGYRYYKGIHVKKDMDLSLYYYSRLSKILFDTYLAPNRNIGNDDPEIFNVRLYDFSPRYELLNSASNKQINTNSKWKNFKSNMDNPYGAFEIPNSLVRNIENFIDQTSLNDLSLDETEIIYAKKYYKAVAKYNGDYIFRRNHTKAFELANECATSGIKIRPQYFQHSEGIKISNDEVSKYLELFFINQCISLVGHLYLRGEGVEQDFDKAYDWIVKSESIGYTPQQMNDLGLIYEFGSVSRVKQNLTHAAILYNISGEQHNHNGYYNLARLSLKSYIPKLSLEYEQNKTAPHAKSNYNKLYDGILKKFREARNQGSLEAYYELARLLEIDSSVSKSDIISNFKSFVETMEQHVSYLQWSLKSALIGDWQNALLGYSMAAEQGYESAQVSTAFLLHRNPTILSRMTTKNLLYSFPKSRYLAAADYLFKASQQDNVDASVLLGDLHYYCFIDDDDDDNIRNSSSSGTEPSTANSSLSTKSNYQNAFKYYHFAAKRHSSQACWNIGYMYEYGLGVTKDSFLAKRYYDLALEEHPMSFFPVSFSLIRLFLKSVFYNMMGWEIFVGDE